jgi:hypothetical protein
MRPFWPTVELASGNPAEALLTHDSFTLEKIDLLERYFDEQKPKEQLEQLRAILDEFHKNLTEKFEVRDLILKVGSHRGW